VLQYVYECRIPSHTLSPPGGSPGSAPSAAPAAPEAGPPPSSPGRARGRTALSSKPEMKTHAPAPPDTTSGGPDRPGLHSGFVDTPVAAGPATRARPATPGQEAALSRRPWGRGQGGPPRDRARSRLEREWEKLSEREREGLPSPDALRDEG